MIRRILGILFFLHLYFRSCEALLRYLLLPLHLTSLVTIPGIIGAAVAAWQLSSKPGYGRIFLILIFFPFAVALLRGNNLFSALTGMYVFHPAVLGAGFHHAGGTYTRNLRRLCVALAVITCLGIILDYYFEVPWLRLNYETAGVTQDVSKNWTTAGIRRLSGFSRASFEAANILVLTFAIVAMTAQSSFLLLLFFVLLLGSIVLTTSKASVASLIIIFAVATASRLSLTPFLISTYCLSVVSIALPVLSANGDLQLSLKSDIESLILASFSDRLSYTWPSAIQSNSEISGEVFGLGYGGAGIASEYANAGSYNAADNLFVYFWCITGAWAFAIATLSAVAARRTGSLGGSTSPKVSWTTDTEVLLPLNLALVCIGMAENGIESASFGVLWGYATIGPLLKRTLHAEQAQNNAHTNGHF